MNVCRVGRLKVTCHISSPSLAPQSDSFCCFLRFQFVDQGHADKFGHRVLQVVTESGSKALKMQMEWLLRLLDCLQRIETSDNLLNNSTKTLF
jgi:hypothetical protein